GYGGMRSGARGSQREPWNLTSANARSATAPFALAHVDIVRAHVVRRLQALPPALQVQLQQHRSADRRGHIEVEADRLVHVPLAARVLPHRGELVHLPRAL